MYPHASFSRQAPKMKRKMADVLSGTENVGVFIHALDGLEKHLGPELDQQTKTKIRDLKIKAAILQQHMQEAKQLADELLQETRLQRRHKTPGRNHAA